MIILTVTHYNGAPAERLEASFDELGGSIGRAPDNQLVLPDPERTVSRVHAQVVFRNGGYALVDRGSNPVQVNGRALGHGREQSLSGGDSLQIGGYTLQVRAGQAAKASSPFDDLFAPPTAAPPPPAAAPRAAPAPWSAPAASPWATPAPSPWAAPVPAPSPRATPAPGGIPLDWDPMAPDVPDTSPQVRRPSGAAGPPDGLLNDLGLGLDRPSSADRSLDDLFGLGAAAPAHDPLAALQRAAPGPAAPSTSANPIADLLAPRPAAPAPQALQAGGLQQPWQTPAASPAVIPATPPLTPPITPPITPPADPAPAGAVFSWSTPARDGKVVTLPPSVTQPVVRARAEAPALPQPVAATAPAVAALPPAEAGWREALLQGLGLPADAPLPLDAALLRRIGALLREATQGSVQLLQARAEVKRSVRAEMTAIVPRGNNPLKFSPSADTALLHLLGPQLPGFLPAETAMHEAFDDLRAHELAVLTGMRAALDGVLQRFDPAGLEARIEKKTGLGGLLAGSRKARLWELFEQQYASIRQEAADDFQDFFGRAFLQAYEAQLDRLADEAEQAEQERGRAGA